jgi:hypothetical protein
MPHRRLVAAVPLTLVLALPGAAQAQGIVPGESKLRHNGIGSRAPWALQQECV